MLRTMSARQFGEWLAFDELDPIGDERGDLHAGIVAAAVLAPWRAEGADPPRPIDLMPRFGARPPQPRTQSDDEMLQVFLRLSRSAPH